MSLVLEAETGVSGGQGENRLSVLAGWVVGTLWDVCLYLTLKRGLLFSMAQRMVPPLI